MTNITPRSRVLAALAHKGGGYIMSPAKPILPDVPLANATALIDAIVNQPAADRSGLSDDELAHALARVYSAYHA